MKKFKIMKMGLFGASLILTVAGFIVDEAKERVNMENEVDKWMKKHADELIHGQVEEEVIVDAEIVEEDEEA